MTKKILERWNAEHSGFFDAAGTASVIGLHLVSGIIVGGTAGYFLDEWLGTSPWMKLIFFFVGIIAGFLNIYRDTKRLLKAQEERDAAKNKTEN